MSTSPTPLTGRELDHLIAVKVMGWRWKRDQNFNVATREPVGKPFRYLVSPDSVFKDIPDWDGKEDADVATWPDGGLPAYSSDWNAMRLVVERMTSWGWNIDLSWGERPNPEKVQCNVYDGECKCLAAVSEATAPLAVCRCALSAVAQEARP